MENSSLINNISESNGQNNNSNQLSNIPISSNKNFKSIHFNLPNLNKLNSQFYSTRNLNLYPNGINSQPNDQKKPIRRYNSQKIKEFLAKESKTNLGPIKEIVLDDQNEKALTNNPKKRFIIKEENPKKKEKKKLSLVEEARDFDRKQQISMEKYLNEIKQKKFEIQYNKSLKNKYENLNFYDNFIPRYNSDLKQYNNISFNNGIIDQEDNNQKENLYVYNTPAEKDINNDENNNESEQKIFKTDINKENNVDEFEQMKQKYFSKSNFSPRFTNTEYKTRYLDNYFKKDSLVKNLFCHYLNVQNNNYNNFNSEQNNNNTSPTNINNINFNSSINNSIALKPSIQLNQTSTNNNELNSPPKLIYKNNIEYTMNNNTDTKNTNNRYGNNINEQSVNSNMNSMTNLKYLYHKNKSSENFAVENNYDEIFKSIDERLLKNKYSKKDSNFDKNCFFRTSSSNKNKSSSGINKKNNFKNLILDNQKSYNFFNIENNQGYNNFKLSYRFFCKNINSHRTNFYK